MKKELNIGITPELLIGKVGTYKFTTVSHMKR